MWDKKIYPELYASLRDKMTFQALREVLLAAHGLKVARLCPQEGDIPAIVEILEKTGLYIGLHKHKLLLSADQGKGGWISGYGIELPLETPVDGFLQMYIGRNAEHVLAAQKAEHTYQYAYFGKLLGYPPCCIEFYEKNLKTAEMEQGDFFLDLLTASINYLGGKLPVFPSLTNIGAQYFGYGLLSFYPCSFFCPHAMREAEIAIQLIQRYDPDLACAALAASRMPLLYTEYEGIYAFPEASLKGPYLFYDAEQVKNTLNGVISDLLHRGDRILIRSAHSVHIYKGNDLLARLESPRLGMLLFD